MCPRTARTLDRSIMSRPRGQVGVGARPVPFPSTAVVPCPPVRRAGVCIWTQSTAGSVAPFEASAKPRADRHGTPDIATRLCRADLEQDEQPARSGKHGMPTAMRGRARAVSVQTSGPSEAARRSVLFSALDDASANELWALARTQTVEAHERLADAGEGRSCVYLVLDGALASSLETGRGSSVVTSLWGPGDLVNASTALWGRHAPTLLISLVPTDVLVFPADRLRRLMEASPLVGMAIARALSHVMRRVEADVVALEVSDATGRVLRRLVDLAQRFGTPTDDGLEIVVPLSQEELGNWAGVSREATARVLQGLRGAGLLETGRRRLTIVDPDGLRHLMARQYPAVLTELWL